MATQSYLRGHKMHWQGEEWLYSDTNKPTAHNPRPCGHCKLPDREDDHDACLGALPGVSNACCGHGQTNHSYIQFENGIVVRGFNIIEEMGILFNGA